MIVLLLLLTACAAPMEPEDCFEDEVYDPVDQVCYLEDEELAEGGFGSWLGGFLDGLVGAVYGIGAEDEGDTLLTYDVDGNALDNRQLVGDTFDEDLPGSDAQFEAMWREFAQIIPSAERTQITQFGIFSDGRDGTLAFVEPITDAPTNWIIVLDPADTADKREFTYTLIHEFAHVLTLNSTQVPFDEVAYFAEDDATVDAAMRACPRFFTGEGCANRNSYIDQFYQKFWTSFADEHGAIDPEDSDALLDFYERYADHFVTDYAATNPGEDIAESWTHFVLNDPPAGDSVAEEKILFFYDFPELVELRSEILARIYSQSRR